MINAIQSAVIALGVAMGPVALAAVFVTPGSLAGYTYFPPKNTSGGNGSGTGSSGPVETLQKCYTSVKRPDATFTFDANKFYGLSNINLYYKAVGGNGGEGNGGGGGSTAILLNGSVAALAPGGDGGTLAATPVSGHITIAPGDRVRVVTGGGGGDGEPGKGGGGGGAGWTGGGAGSSAEPGKGGGALPGRGGDGPNPGTSGIGHNGGVSTYPNGSSAPIGDTSVAAGSFFEILGNGELGNLTKLDARIPATPIRSGSLGVPPDHMNLAPNYYTHISGSGGAWGFGGTPVVKAKWLLTESYPNEKYHFFVRVSMTGYSLTGCFYDHACSVTSGSAEITRLADYPNPNDFNFTRTDVRGKVGYHTNLPGQVVFMYSAVECAFLK